MRKLGKCLSLWATGSRNHGTERGCGWGTRKRTCPQHPPRQTPLGCQSYKQQTSLYHRTSKICFMLFLIEDSYLIDPSPAACRLRWQREKKINLDPTVHCCFPSLLDYLFLSLCLFNGERTALCSNFEQQPCGHSSPSYSRELCYSTKKSGATPLLDQMA